MARTTRIALGLNSGTSADGVDAVACEIRGRGLGMKVHVLGRVSRKYPAQLRRRILAVMAPAATTTEEVCRLNTEIGRAFAEAGAAVVRKLGLKWVDLVGSHGQTVCHLPPRRKQKQDARNRRVPTPGTLQLGDSTIIAQALGVPVVSQFRQADMAVGGQGAPLVPWTDYVLFHHAKKNRIIQNIGGIANLTWLPAGGVPEDVIAFDTGPGNMVIDALVRHFTKGREQFDRGGRIAARGELIDEIEWTMTRAGGYLMTPPPKSCGREEFGEKWVKQLLVKYRFLQAAMPDWVQTAAFSAVAMMVSSYAAYLPMNPYERGQLDEVILCGGGALNAMMMKWLNRSVGVLFPGARVSSMHEHGIEIQAKECVSFAMLAAARVDRVAANLPRVTGARRAVILGHIYEP